MTSWAYSTILVFKRDLAFLGHNKETENRPRKGSLFQELLTIMPMKAHQWLKIHPDASSRNISFLSNLKDWAHEGQKEREEVPVQEEAVFGMDSRVTEWKDVCFLWRLLLKKKGNTAMETRQSSFHSHSLVCYQIKRKWTYSRPSVILSFFYLGGNIFSFNTDPENGKENVPVLVRRSISCSC